MRVAWSTLIVLVLLAPFGRVGITATPDVEAVTMPRGSTTSNARVGAPVRDPGPSMVALLAGMGFGAVRVALPARVDRVVVIAAPPVVLLASLVEGADARARAPPV